MALKHNFNIFSPLPLHNKRMEEEEEGTRERERRWLLGDEKKRQMKNSACVRTSRSRKSYPGMETNTDNAYGWSCCCFFAFTTHPEMKKISRSGSAMVKAKVEQQKKLTQWLAFQCALAAICNSLFHSESVCPPLETLRGLITFFCVQQTASSWALIIIFIVGPISLANSTKKGTAGLKLNVTYVPSSYANTKNVAIIAKPLSATGKTLFALSAASWARPVETTRIVYHQHRIWGRLWTQNHHEAFLCFGCHDNHNSSSS